HRQSAKGKTVPAGPCGQARNRTRGQVARTGGAARPRPAPPAQGLRGRNVAPSCVAGPLRALSCWGIGRQYVRHCRVSSALLLLGASGLEREACAAVCQFPEALAGHEAEENSSHPPGEHAENGESQKIREVMFPDDLLAIERQKGQHGGWRL